MMVKKWWATFGGISKKPRDMMITSLYRLAEPEELLHYIRILEPLLERDESMN